MLFNQIERVCQVGPVTGRSNTCRFVHDADSPLPCGSPEGPNPICSTALFAFLKYRNRAKGGTATQIFSYNSETAALSMGKEVAVIITNGSVTEYLDTLSQFFR